MSATSEQNNCDAHLHDTPAAASLTVTAASSTPPASTMNTLAEIESLKQALLEKQTQLIAMETACLRESDRQVELEDSVIAWQDKYDRLYESHKRVQKVNQNLEDKLLKLVERNTGERANFQSDVATLSVRLAQANFNIAKLQREIERYKADINLAIQLLQCKPESFMPQKVSSLPIDIQSKVSAYMRLETNSHSDSECSNSGVGVATSASYKVLPASDSPPPAPCPFPPTAMVYSMRGLDGKNIIEPIPQPSVNNNNNSTNNNNNNNNSKDSINNNSGNNISNNNNNKSNICNSNNSLHTGGDPDLISPITMAKFLEDELKAGEVKHCDTCQCAKQDLTVLADISRSYTVATQTPFQQGTTNLNEPLGQLCLRCNSNLNSPSRTNSPYLMKLVRSSDSVISETKSSVSDLNDMDKLFTPAKKDDLMVNPILGHHRLCDRTSGSAALAASGGVSKLHSSMLYSNSHLGNTALDGGSQQAGSYARRYLESMGTPLDLLEKYDQNSSGVGVNSEKLAELNGTDDYEDEARPLLSGMNQAQTIVETAKSGKLHEVLESQTDQLRTPVSTCSAANIKSKVSTNGLMRSNISGSVNSLWSRTSSCEGAKIFENFNRNLIKTIKAENPKHRGPRLCAMRIQQNGQSNILLDNLESIEDVTPVFYKRRERLLDEELDDTKDIITSTTTMTVQTAPLVEINTPVREGVVKENTTVATILTNISNEGCRNGVTGECLGAADSCSEACVLSGESKNMVDPALSNTSILLNTAPKTVITENESEKMTCFLDVTEEAKRMLKKDNSKIYSLDLQGNNLIIERPKAPDTEKQSQSMKLATNSFDVVRNGSSSKNSLNSKSCTQSSSISDAIDIQESVILRRQQLSRVAEWVQNNTQQLEQQQQEVISALNNCGSSGTDRQSSLSTLDRLDSVSTEKLSMDSGYKTTPQPHTKNGYIEEVNKSTGDSLSPKTTDSVSNPISNSSSNNNNNNNTINNQDIRIISNGNENHLSHQQVPPVVTTYRRTTRSGLPVAYTTEETEIDLNANSCSTPIMPEPPTCDILNYKYYPSESDKSRAIEAELHTTTQNVDIAQMEYNVKQFLLKQNEWSMRNSRSFTSSTGASIATSKSESIAPSQKYQHTPKNLRHKKLFSTSSIGPGIGERVHSMPAQGGSAQKNASAVVGTIVSNHAKEAPPIRAMPQRTETNL